MQIVTIKDIARVCGVSVSTVSRAMNGHSDISRKTREHILQVIAESGYVPNNNARNLKRLEARAVALLVKGMDNTFFQKMRRPPAKGQTAFPQTQRIFQIFVISRSKLSDTFP